MNPPLAGGVPLAPPSHLSDEARAVLSAAEDQLGDLADYEVARAIINGLADSRRRTLLDDGVDFQVEPVDANGVRAFWITPGPRRGSDRVILYAHGGGYVAGEAARVIEPPLRLGRVAGIPVLSVEYRLAPEHPWPAGLNDCLNAHQWLLGQGHAPARIAWTGLSAGGGYVLAMALAAKRQGIPLPGAIYAMAPWADLTLSGDTYRTNQPHDHVLGGSNLAAITDMYAGATDPREPTISPIFGDLRGLPPTLVDAGSREVLLSDAARWAQRARDAGVDVELDVWDGLWHGFHNAPEIPEAHQVTQRGAAFIRAHTAA